MVDYESMKDSADKGEEIQEKADNLQPRLQQGSPIPKEGSRPPEDELWWHTVLQILFPFLMAGAGLVAAGLMLDWVQVCAPSFPGLLKYRHWHDQMIGYL